MKTINIGIVIGILIIAGAYGTVYLYQSPEKINDIIKNDNKDYEVGWKTIARFDLSALGDNDPGSGATGFLSIFGLNYTGETPGTVLQGNGTDWSSAGNVSWYADSDGFSEDCAANVGWYFVVRVRFNKTHCYDTSDNQWVGTRTRVNITVSGDETISGTSGTLVESMNDSSANFLWCNYYWDDSDNGYRVTSDGTVTVSEIKIEAKY